MSETKLQPTNEFVRNYFAEHGLAVISMDENRPWGGFWVYEETAAYDKKLLWVKPGTTLSLQFHGSVEHPGHSEVCTALTEMKVFLGDRNVVGTAPTEFDLALANVGVEHLQPGQALALPAGFLHAYANPFPFDVYLLEVRTSQIAETAVEREGNITRVFDPARRDGLPAYPGFLLERLSV